MYRLCTHEDQVRRRHPLSLEGSDLRAQDPESWQSPGEPTSSFGFEHGALSAAWSGVCPEPAEVFGAEADRCFRNGDLCHAPAARSTFRLSTANIRACMIQTTGG